MEYGKNPNKGEGYKIQIKKIKNVGKPVKPTKSCLR